MAGLAPKLPLRRHDLDGYELIKRHSDLVKQNFKMLLLTHPGERLMDPLFGVGLKQFLFEQNHESTYERVRMKINSQVAKYMPYIDILGIQFRPGSESTNDGSVLSIKIKIFVKPLRLVESFDVKYDYQLDNISFTSDVARDSSTNSGY